MFDLIFRTIAVGAIAWMAWGTWLVNRPSSEFFTRLHHSKSKVNKCAAYWAFMGFLFGLTILVRFPAFWILNLVLPSHWGSYGEYGDWESYSSRLASMVAFAGAILLIYRMNKRQKTLVQLEFYSDKFRPKATNEILAALEEIRPLFANVMYADTVLAATEHRLKSSPKSHDPTEKSKYSPKETAFILIMHTAKDLLSTGQFHVYRGVLTIEGKGMRSAFKIAVKELVGAGVLTDLDAQEQRADMAAAIKEVG